MVENNVESVREKGRYLETIINRKKRTIPIASIEYVESRGRKIVLHLGCGEMTFYSKISDIEEKLVNNGFVRVHQSFMVRMADKTLIGALGEVKEVHIVDKKVDKISLLLKNLNEDLNDYIKIFGAESIMQ